MTNTFPTPYFDEVVADYERIEKENIATQIQIALDNRKSNTDQVDWSKLTCPRCFNKSLKYYQVSDPETGSDAGLTCHNKQNTRCSFVYSFVN